MNTFFNILQTLTNKKNKTYPDDPFTLPTLANQNINELYTNETYHIDFLIKRIFYEEKKSKYADQYLRNSEAKFSSLNFILDNNFYKNEFKEKIFNIFSKSQKCYYAFSRLSRIYKIKKYPIIVNNDLMLNALDIKNKNTFILIEKKSQYLFSLNDLVSIIETAISNSPVFFSEPLSPLNPYNNEPFTYSTLYNIYFKLKKSGRLMSILFHLFFLENFNKEQFSEKNEPIIREISIKNHVYNSPYTILHSSVLTMLKSNPYTRNYQIHKDFPKDTLVTIFRPFLFYFFIINYDIKDTSKINNYKQLLYIKLTKFYKYNKAFGRQYIKIITHLDKIIKQETLFNDNHISFYKISIKKETPYNGLVVVGISPVINILANMPIFADVEDDLEEGEVNEDLDQDLDEDLDQDLDEDLDEDLDQDLDELEDDELDDNSTVEEEEGSIS